MAAVANTTDCDGDLRHDPVTAAVMAAVTTAAITHRSRIGSGNTAPPGRLH